MRILKGAIRAAPRLGNREKESMSDYDFPSVPQIENTYRVAYRTLEQLVTPGRALHIAEEGLCITELVSQFRLVVDEAEMTVTGQLGPLISWTAPRLDGDWSLVVAGADIAGDNDFGGLTLGDDAFRGPRGGWHGSALDCAARAYRREAGWDFTPDATGMWLLMLAPVSAGGGDLWIYSGHLVGFAILHDRDQDGAYESLAHVWTAAAWRRRGIAKRLIAEARYRFSFTGVEGPYTADGGAVLRAVGELEYDSGEAPVPAGRTEGGGDA